MFFAVFLASGCSSPLHPTPERVVTPEPVEHFTLGVLVMGHLSNKPLAGVPMTLVSFDDATPRQHRLTSVEGTVSWRVISGQRYGVLLRDQRETRGTPINGDVQWLMSLPE